MIHVSHKFYLKEGYLRIIARAEKQQTQVVPSTVQLR